MCLGRVLSSGFRAVWVMVSEFVRLCFAKRQVAGFAGSEHSSLFGWARLLGLGVRA